MSKVAIYCRLSVEDEDKREEEDSDSITNQKLLLTEYAMKYEMEIYRIYVDDNYSGLDDKRPSFLEMIEDAKQKKFDVILCKTQSRFTRDIILVEKYIHGLLPELGIRFVSILDNADSDDKGNKRARQINGLVNEWYCEELSDNIRMVLDKKRKDGDFIGSFAPYGYRKSEENHHHLEIDPEAAKNVLLIYNLYLEDYSVKGISEYLESHKVLAPTWYRKEQEHSKANEMENLNSEQTITFDQNRMDQNIVEQYIVEQYIENDRYHWPVSSIKKILHSEVYLGHLVQGKEKKVSYKSKKRIITQKENWFIVYDTHDPIISLTKFQKVQERLYERQKSHQNIRDNKKDILLGKVICGTCGKVMYKTSGNRSNQKYYHCSTYVKSKGKSCEKNSIRCECLLKIIEEQINEQMITEHSIKKDERLHSESLQKITQEIKRIQDEIDFHKKSIVQIYLDQSKGLLEDELYQEVITEVNQKIIYLKQQEKELGNMKNKIMFDKNIEQTEKLIKEEGFAFIHRDANNRDNLMNELIEKIEIKEEEKDKLVNIYWKV
ncbi:recombinase family protein [Anaeromicropila herbilytica]|uniref:Recombinase n=1 Tax=Anaeromicropila herbilytica TaxID=2785025 RepID=A0A7R7IEC1_9FIRM|nr:recombinase family protein [Anaeromicropila herbilytica]BCN31954.1 recombinase [Anaeromicropila herbilytica]